MLQSPTYIASQEKMSRMGMMTSWHDIESDVHVCINDEIW